MDHAASTRAPRQRNRPLVGLAVVCVAIIGSLVLRAGVSSAPRAGAPSGGTLGGRATPAVAGDDGTLPAGVTPFDDRYAGIARLDPDLLGALRSAAIDAAGDGIRLTVNSGWRSAAYQDRLLRDAVSTYGSVAAAARWVATAATSPHVAGEAVDVGPAQAAAWLTDHGAAYGLCRVYRNEPWHFELRPEARAGRCPRMYADPTRDPRMRA